MCADVFAAAAAGCQRAVADIQQDVAEQVPAVEAGRRLERLGAWTRRKDVDQRLSQQSHSSVLNNELLVNIAAHKLASSAAVNVFGRSY